MLTNAPDASDVRRLLDNLELKFVLDSPNDDYRFEYFTTSIKDRTTGDQRLTRTYRLFDLVRGGVTPEPWDAYDVEKQTTLVTNLMRFGHYRMSKVVCGWEVVCPVCGCLMRGKNWESFPKTCTAEPQIKCRAKIDEKSIVEILFAET